MLSLGWLLFMSKRLSDTEIWKKAWFFDMPDKFKLFWFYILSDCDAAGIWTANFRVAEAFLGKFEITKVAELLKDQIVILDANYWLIKDFIKFQYGYPLKENSPMFKKVDSLLKQRNISLDTLYDTVSHTVLYTVKDKEEDKDKDKDKDIGGEGGNLKPDPITNLGWVGEEISYQAINNIYPKLFLFKLPLKFDEHQKLLKKYGAKQVELVYNEMQNYKDLLKKSESAYLTATNWINRKLK